MKRLFAILLIFLFSAQSISAQTRDVDRLGIRILLNKGVEPPASEQAYCSAADQDILQTKFSSILGRRMLRANRELQTCSSLCSGFAKGSCYLVYRSCTGWRRELEATELEQQDEEDLFVLEATDETHAVEDFHEEGVRVLQGGGSSEVDNMCSNLTSSANRLIVNYLAIGGLSGPCRKELAMTFSVQCFLF